MPKSHIKTATSPKDVTVTVTILKDKPSEFDMAGDGVLPVKKIKHQGKDEFMLTFSNFEDDGTYHDGFRITFSLVDNTGKGYGFFQDPNGADPSDAVSVKCVGRNGHCPKRGQKWDGFTPISVSADRQTLVVDHPNQYLQYFGFGLHFSRDRQTKPSLSFDPIGDDQNGQRR